MEIKKIGNHKYELRFVTYKDKEYLVRLSFPTPVDLVAFAENIINVKVFDKEMYQKVLWYEKGLVYEGIYYNVEKKIMEIDLPALIKRVFDDYETQNNINKPIHLMTDWDGKVEELMYTIQKQVADGIEYLPDATETPLMEGDIATYSNKVNLAIQLYQAIAKRENYYQFNSPTAFGDPEYARYSGIVTGILIGSGYEEVKTDTSIVIQKNEQKLLVIDRIQRRNSYYDEQEVIESLLNKTLH